jgi:aminoglycoside/choline kinase family phosphotransferase
VDAFVALATWLRDRGLAAPEVLAFDAEQGFALLEDLGDALFARVLEADPTPERDLYASAVETLASLHQHQAPSVVARDTAHWPLLSYDAAAMHAEANLLVEWWADRHLDVHLDDEALASWRMAWSSAFTLIQQPKPVLVLRDFHAENTLWRPHDSGVRRVGLIDFQDALAGHPAYDLVSLLEDARRDVSPELAAQMVDHYIAVAAPADNEAFRAGYAVLGAQRNAKIIGIFARLAIRDGKARYLDLIPRVAGHMGRDLQHEVMRSLALWMERYLPGALERAAT